jgi:hypothetical protein
VTIAPDGVFGVAISGKSRTLDYARLDVHVLESWKTYWSASLLLPAQTSSSLWGMYALISTHHVCKLQFLLGV